MADNLPSTVVLSTSRQAALFEELTEAIRHTSRGEIASWGKDSARLFGSVTVRRVKNIGKLLVRVGSATGKEVSGAYRAYKRKELKTHTHGRAVTARDTAINFGKGASGSVKQLAAALRAHPSEVAPALVVTVLAFLAASGGLDGDGGVPDLDLLGGIGAHRSIFTHSIISGAVIETSLLASAQLISVVYAHLPARHDAIWDAIAKNKDRYVIAASQGASLGIAYHLFIDSTLDIGTYHDLPFSMPIEGHEAVISTNAAAEGFDVFHKKGGKDG